MPLPLPLCLDRSAERCEIRYSFCEMFHEKITTATAKSKSRRTLKNVTQDFQLTVSKYVEKRIIGLMSPEPSLLRSGFWSVLHRLIH